MNSAGQSFLSLSPVQPASSLIAAQAQSLDRDLSRASPAEIVTTALHEVGDPAIPIVFLDTGWLFPETLAYRDTLTNLLGLSDVRTIHPLTETPDNKDKVRDLWFSNPDLCCFIRKVEPLTRALHPFGAWINGRKRFQGGDRASISVVEADGGRLKFNPLANVSADELKALYATMNLPPHPLVASGFTSIGCMPCTTRTEPGEDPRAGRWRDRDKIECGIHVATDIAKSP